MSFWGVISIEKQFQEEDRAEILLGKLEHALQWSSLGGQPFPYGLNQSPFLSWIRIGFAYSTIQSDQRIQLFVCRWAVEKTHVEVKNGPGIACAQKQGFDQVFDRVVTIG